MRSKSKIRKREVSWWRLETTTISPIGSTNAGSLTWALWGVDILGRDLYGMVMRESSKGWIELSLIPNSGSSTKKRCENSS
ncbi:hypothetical protein AHAS_Ahas18G0187800 [Arachis hypogaea]